MSTATKAIHGDERARQALAAVFVDILKTQDTDDSLPCPIAIWTLSQILFEASNKETSLADRSLRNRIRKRSPDVLHQIVHFLTRPRPDETRRRLAIIPMPAHSQCPCTGNPDLWSNPLVRESHTIHGYRPFPSLSALRAILRCLFIALGTTIDYGTSAKKAIQLAQKTAQNGRPAPWPSCLQDVLPHGIVPSISALCAWTEFYPVISVLRTIDTVYEGILISTFPSLFVQIIMPRAFFPVATAHIKACESALRTGQVHQGHGGALRDFIILSTSITNLEELDNRQLLAAADDNLALLKLLRDLCTQSNSLIHKALRKGVHTTPEVRRELECAVTVFTTTTIRITALLAAPKLPPVSSTPFSRYGKFVVRSIVCARPGCCLTYFATSVPLRRCSGCMVTHYCSENCQADAWRHPTLPHKKVCVKLQEALHAFANHVGDLESKDGKAASVLAESTVDILGHLERLYIRECVDLDETGTLTEVSSGS